MEKFEKFKKYMTLYRRSMLLEDDFKKLGIDLNPEAGIQLLIDELLSWIPDLILNNPDVFWTELRYDDFDCDENFENYVKELWEKINQ
jgi:hypothetical protein